jgi:beta-lactamase class A
MLGSMKSVLLGTRLSPSSREQLLAWLLGCKTGAAKLRAGLPASWKVGDKTGMGEHGAANDVAILWPPGREPILVAAYSVGSQASTDDRNAALASVARVVVQFLGGGDSRWGGIK